MKRAFLILLGSLLLFTACQSVASQAPTPAPATATSLPPSATPAPLPSATPSPTPATLTLWLAPDLPATFWDGLRLDEQSFNPVDVPQGASLRVEILAPADAAQTEFKTPWVYALAAPFNTTLDGVTFAQLRYTWQGKALAAPIVTSPETCAVLTGLLGPPSFDVVTLLPADQLLEAAWKNNAWALLPFEDLEPRWKVLQVNALTPLDAALDLQKYPLTAWIGLAGEATASPQVAAIQLPTSNRNLAEMTSLVMTGTTALARHTAEQMELQGITYPAEEIVGWLTNADFTHISSEAPFYTNCPPAVPFKVQARFCSAPKNIELLDYIGADIIELTGNHLMDWKAAAMLETLALFQQHGYQTYGGGANLQEAQKPLLIEHNGNRLAFVGCNAVGPEIDFADKDRPGSLQCDRQALAAQVTQLRAQGYLPIVTFQHYEVYDFVAPSALRTDFRSMADAGAVIVSGSHAHVPHGFSFYHGSFLSYGLGNLFFDQMEKLSRPGLIERHTFYRGRHISTEVFTTNLVNSARRQPLVEDDRQALLAKLFTLSDWDLPQ